MYRMQAFSPQFPLEYAHNLTSRKRKPIPGETAGLWPKTRYRGKPLGFGFSDSLAGCRPLEAPALTAAGCLQKGRGVKSECEAATKGHDKLSESITNCVRR